MNFKFQSLLGAPYRGGTLVMSGNDLLTPVGNRVTQVSAARSSGLECTMQGCGPGRVASGASRARRCRAHMPPPHPADQPDRVGQQHAAL